MEKPVGSFTSLLRAFGVEPRCTLCPCSNEYFDKHTTSTKHYNIMYNLVEHSELGRENLWHETCIVGGRARYNHLDGQWLVQRDMPVLETHATRPEDLPSSGQWKLIGKPAVVPVVSQGDSTMWPNMWSHRHWKEHMQRAVVRACKVVAANGASKFFCLFCPDETFNQQHLLGPKHFMALMTRLPETVVVQVDQFWQICTFETDTGAMAFNHADGTLQMVRRADGSQSIAPVQACVSTDERIWAEILPRPSPPPSMEAEVTMPSSIATPVAATPDATVAVTPSGFTLQCGGTVFPWTKFSPVDLHPPATCDDLEMQHHSAIGGGGGALMWCWQRIREVERLEKVLTTALGDTTCRYCDLCKRRIGLTDSFADHVAGDGSHFAQVQARCEQESPDDHGWVQSWSGVAQLNHLTLEVSIDESAVDALKQHYHATQGAPASSRSEVDYEVHPTTVAQFETYVDPSSGQHWYYNIHTRQGSWSNPVHGGQAASPIATVAVGPGGEQCAFEC